MLGPILFLIYVNDIDDGLSSKISKFADDTKTANKVTTASDKENFKTILTVSPAGHKNGKRILTLRNVKYYT